MPTYQKYSNLEKGFPDFCYDEMLKNSQYHDREQ